MLFAHCPLPALITWIYAFVIYPIILVFSLMFGILARKGSSARKVCVWTGVCATALLGLLILTCEVLFG